MIFPILEFITSSSFGQMWGWNAMVWEHDYIVLMRCNDQIIYLKLLQCVMVLEYWIWNVLFTVLEFIASTSFELELHCSSSTQTTPIICNTFRGKPSFNFENSKLIQCNFKDYKTTWIKFHLLQQQSKKYNIIFLMST